MKSQLYKITAFTLVLLVLFSCGNRINQNSMFKGRNHTSKKSGVYDAGMNGKDGFKKPPSLQIKKEYDKLSKYDKNPKKGVKKATKEREKKKRKSAKARNKYNRKRKVKIDKVKGKTAGDT